MWRMMIVMTTSEISYQNTLTYLTHPYIEDYFDAVATGKIEVCKEQLLLINYLKEDVLSREDLYIDHQRVNDSVEIPKKYFPYDLFLWQKFCNVFIFGLRYKEDNMLFFTRYFLYMGRGAGKNGYFSYNAFYMLSKAHGIKNYHIDIVATAQDQAKTSFDDVFHVIKENEKKLKSSFSATKEKITSKKTGSTLVFNTSNAKTKDSKRTGCVLFDEEHGYENWNSIKVFQSGGGKIADYREFHCSTDGNIRGGPLDDLKEEAQLVLNREIKDSTLFPFICKLDDPSEVDNPKMWEKANPSYRYNKNLQRKMKDEYRQMKRQAEIRIEFMTKRMNCPVEDTRFKVCTDEERRATNQIVPYEEMQGIDAVGGVDFAELRDFCAVGVLVKHKGKRYWLQHTFIHKKALELQDINKDIVQIAIDKGLAEIVHTDKIEEQRVVNWFLEMSKKFFIKKITIDQMRAVILKPLLEEAGFTVETTRSGKFTHTALSQLVDDMFIQKSIVFGDDPLMRWYVNNVYIEFLGNGNKEYKKIDPEKRKTDGFFAFLHALNEDQSLIDMGNVDYSQIRFKPIVF